MNVVALSQSCLPCGRPQTLLKAPKGTCDTDLYLLRRPSGTSTHALLAGNAGHSCLTTPRRSPRPCRVRAVATGTDKKPKSQASAMEAAEKRWESQVRGFLQLLDLSLLVCNTAYIERLVLQKFDSLSADSGRKGEECYLCSSRTDGQGKSRLCACIELQPYWLIVHCDIV